MTKKISTTKLVWLHLYPGLLIGGLYILLTPSINNFGYPSIMSLMISALLVIIPLELGYLLYAAKSSGNRTIRDILVNKAIGVRKFIGIIIGGIVLSFLVVGLMQFVDDSIKKNVFEWLPNWYMYDEEFKNGYAKQALMVTGLLRIFFDGLIIPYIEEIYFRGYLLPRIKAKGIVTPILATILFAMYHFWQPWNYPSLLAVSAILVFPAWYFKNYKISLYIHVTINFIGAILFYLMIMQ
ncbi:lysostaphin resistance A-like protein [Winogradskyella sp.]|uniref:CPBP family intramembrane glutamic endopeptidase n=1 Tax=Winogradskyella sp. TaxID=1883156 RepID=UPI003514D7F5